MAFKIVYTENALADLEAILDYILADNPAAASRFGNDLLNHVDLLAAFPHIGSPVKRRAEIRKITLVGQTIAFCGLPPSGALADDKNRSSAPPKHLKRTVLGVG